MDQIGSSDIFSDLKVDEESKSLLQSTAKWAKWMAIIGLTSSLLVIVALVITSVVGAQGDPYLAGVTVGSTLIIVIPVVAVLVILNIFALKFGTSTSTGLETVRQDAFNQGIAALKNYFKTLGIAIIVMIGLIILVIIAFGIGSTM